MLQQADLLGFFFLIKTTLLRVTSGLLYIVLCYVGSLDNGAADPGAPDAVGTRAKAM